MSLLYHAYVYLEFLILACTIYILAPFLPPLESGDTVQTVTSAYVQEFNRDVNTKVKADNFSCLTF